MHINCFFLFDAAIEDKPLELSEKVKKQVLSRNIFQVNTSAITLPYRQGGNKLIKENANYAEDKNY